MVKEEVCRKSNNDVILPYRERLYVNTTEKKKIVEKAMNFIHDNGKYFFDVSTSVQFLAQELNKNVIVFTHSLDNFKILSEKSNVLVNLISGEFNTRNRFFYREDYEKYLNGIEFDSAFLGAGAIRSDGVYYENEEDAFVKREVVKRSKKVILLAEHQKYEKTAKYKGLDLEQANIIIVDPIAISLFIYIIASQNIKINPNSLVII